MLTSLLRDETKAIGLGMTELMMNGYIADAPSLVGSSCILALFSKGCPSLSPGFQVGFGLLTTLTFSGTLQIERKGQEWQITYGGIIRAGDNSDLSWHSVNREKRSRMTDRTWKASSSQ